MPPERRSPRARPAQGRLYGVPYRRPTSPLPSVTTIRVTMPAPTSDGGVQIPDTPTEGSAPDVDPGMPLDIRMFLRARRLEAGGTPSSPPSPRPRSPLQRSRHGSEPPSRGLPVPLQQVSRSGIKKTTKKSSRQSAGHGNSPRSDATRSQRKSNLSRANISRRIEMSAETVIRTLDEARAASNERVERSTQRRPEVVEDEGSLDLPSVRPQIPERPTENGIGEEPEPPTRRSVRRGTRRVRETVREQPLEVPAHDENEPPRQRGTRRTVRRRRVVATNTINPAAGLNDQQLGGDGRVAPGVQEPVPALPQQVARENTHDQRRQVIRAPRASHTQGREQRPRLLTHDALRANGRVLTATNPIAEERFIQGVLQLRRRVEETFVPEGQQARAPAPQPAQQMPRRVGLTDISMNSLNNGPVVVRGREVRQGVATLRQQPRQRPGARTNQDNLRGALGFR